MIERLEYLEDLAEVYKGKWLLATGQETMTRLTEEEMAVWAEESDVLRSPKNTQRLLESMAELENGQGIRRELIE